MKKLDITKVEVIEGKTLISYHTYLTDSSNEDSSGIWEVEGTLTNEEALEYAKTMVAPELIDTTEVVLNLEVNQ